MRETLIENNGGCAMLCLECRGGHEELVVWTAELHTLCLMFQGEVDQ